MADQSLNAEEIIDQGSIAEVHDLEGLEQLHAISTEARRRILQLLVDQPMTVTQLGRAMEMPPPTAQHHVRELMRVGIVRLVATRERRGILEKYYRAIARRFLLPTDPLAGRSPSEQLETVNELLDDISHHVSAVLSGYRGGEEPEDAVQLAVRVLFLRAEDLPRIAEQIEAILEPYVKPRQPELDREHIVVHLAVPAHPSRDLAGERRAENPPDPT
jgi:DNA-binding transcriptional ArsR family regulator